MSAECVARQALAAVALGLASAMVAAQGAVAFDEALAHYEQQRFAAAFAELSRLADGGHAEAARVAVLMSAHGPRLYGQAFAVERARLARWLDLASASVPGQPRQAFAQQEVK
jgi:hypothetical protein